MEGRAPLPVLLSTEHGRQLQDLASVFTLVWATTWTEDANRLISPLLGLPSDIPVITWPDGASRTAPPRGRHGFWKTPLIAEWLGEHAPGVAWVWVDDQLNRYDRAWLAHWYADASAPPHLLLRIDPNVGLVAADFDRLRAWAAALPR